MGFPAHPVGHATREVPVSIRERQLRRVGAGAQSREGWGTRMTAGLAHQPAKGVEMELTCPKCGYSGDYTEFRYLCKNG